MDKYTIDTDNEQFVSIDDEYAKLNYIRDENKKTLLKSQELFAFELKNGLGAQMKDTLKNPNENKLKVVKPMKYRFNNFIGGIKVFFDKLIKIFD